MRFTMLRPVHSSLVPALTVFASLVSGAAFAESIAPGGPPATEPGTGLQQPGGAIAPSEAPPQKLERVRMSEYFSIGLGGMFSGGGNFFDKPGEQTLPAPNGDPVIVTPEYPGFAGSAIGGGGFIDLRIMDWGGIEFDVLQQTDKGKAELTINNVSKFDIEIQQASLHMPLLFKLVIPAEVAQPMFFLGPEFVVPTGDREVVEAKQTSGPAGAFATKFATAPESALRFMFGFGFEFKLPVPVVDVRIPFTLRGAYNPGVSDKRSERQNTCSSTPEPECNDFNGTAVTQTEFKTAFQWQAAGTLGLSVHF